MNTLKRLLVSLGLLAERSAEVTLAEIEDHLESAVAAKQAYVESLDAAAEAAKAHNAAATAKINALTTSIANIQSGIDQANSHLVAIWAERGKAAA